MLLYNFLYESAQKYNNKRALVYNNLTFTYDELRQITDNLYCFFKFMGINSDDRVACILNNSPELVVSIFALSRGNNVTLLLNPSFSFEEILSKIKNAKIHTIILEHELYFKIVEVYPNISRDYLVILDKRNNLGICSIDEMCLVNHFNNLNKLDFNVNLKDPALIQTSSGTTNTSKMAYRSNENLYEDSNNIIKTFNYLETDLIYSAVPFYHGYGLTMALISPIRNGLTIVFEKWFMANRFLQRYKEYDNFIFIGVPENYELLNKSFHDDTIKISNGKWFFCSSSALHREIGLNFKENFGVWINQVYGMMEVSTICANLDPNEDNFMSVGTPVGNVEVRVDNNILVKSKTISPSYIIDSTDFDINLNDEWFNTNDIGQFIDDNLVVKGRKL
jgi:long-chain acyl-CoA synthetase